MSDPRSNFTPGPLSQWKGSAWLYPLLACFLLLLLFSSKRIGSYDLGTHLAGGRWIVQNHAFPAKDTFTYTQTDRDYQDPHSLYQVALYLCEEFLGYSALNIAHMAAVFLVFAILWWRLDLSRCSPGLAVLLSLVSILIMERRFVIRPEIFSWLFLSLTLLVLELRAKGKDHLVLLPVLQFLWINTEGLFMLGWFAMAAYALSGRLHQERWDPKLVRYGLLSFGADLLNPYFLKGLTFPVILLTRFQDGNLYKRTVSEFSSPWSYFRTEGLHHDSNLPVILFFLLLGLCLLSFLLTLRSRKCHEFLLLAAFGWLGFSMVRNIPLFTLVSVPLLASSLKDLALARGWNWVPDKKVPLIMALLIASFSLRVMTNAYYVNDRRVDRFGWGLDPEGLPIRAAEFLTQNHLEGRIINHLDFGGWLDWKGPQRTFIDGRLEVMEDGFFGSYLRSFQGTGLTDLITKYQPQLILMEYNAAYGWVEQLSRLPAWRLIYLDECAAIYAERGYAPKLPPVSYPALLSPRGIPPETDASVERQLGMIDPSPFRTWVEGYYRPQRYPMGLSSLGLFSLRTGQYTTARDIFMECLRRSGGGFEEVDYNLGVTYLRLDQFALGKAFLQRSLRSNPKNPSALRMLNDLNNLIPE